MTVQNKGGSWAINALSRELKMNLNTKKKNGDQERQRSH